MVGEDQAIFRDGIAHVLEQGGFEVAATAGDAPELTRKIRAHHPDIAITDIQMPPDHTDDGLRAVLEARRLQRGLGILLLSKFLEHRYALELVADGAEGVGYMLKEKVGEIATFTDAVRRVAGGGTALDPDVIAMLVGRRRNAGPLDELTKRELEVLELIAQGRSNPGIAGHRRSRGASRHPYLRQARPARPARRPPTRTRGARIPQAMTDLPLTSDAIVDTYGFLSSILTGIAQPVWVVDPVGDIRFANPAAAAALGYDDPAELHGKPSHETIHYKHPDGSHYPVEECPMLRPRRTGETIHSDEDWFVRRDGTMVPVEYWSAPIPTQNGRGAVVAFSDIHERLQIEEISRQRDVAEARAAEARAGQRRIVQAGDAARARLTRDLHDGAQQQFLNTVLYLQRAQNEWTDAPEHAKALVGLAIQEARSGIDGLRELAVGIHPAILTTRGLAAALDALAGRLPFRLELQIAPTDLPPAIEASIYFFCSEALTNITKHAKADAARVTTIVADGHLHVEVSDNGVGVEIDAGNGLSALSDRIAALDGTLEVISPPSGGTTLEARIPFAI